MLEETQASPSEEELKPYNTKLYLDGGQFFKDIQKFRAGAVRTGFANFDDKTDGLFPGLYVLGAIPSLGKTTFISQLADQVAAAMHHVLFFSLEMSRREMLAKSLARINYKINPREARTGAELFQTGWPKNELAPAGQEYKKRVGDRVSIIEGAFNLTVRDIRERAAAYIEHFGESPVVFVDYLQITGIEERGYSDKQRVDANMTELKLVSRDLGIPVIVVSSLNRASYLQPIDMDALKESGGIEYTADVVLGMQLDLFNDEEFLRERNPLVKREMVLNYKARDPRRIELVCLKNRFGKSGFSCFYNYYPAYDYFEEIDEDEADYDAVDWGAIDLDAVKAFTTQRATPKKKKPATKRTTR